MKKFGLYAKIFGGFIAVLILMIIIGTVSYLRMADGAEVSSFVAESSLPVIEHADETVAKLHEAGYYSVQYRFTLNSEMYNRANALLDDALKSSIFIENHLTSINYNQTVINDVKNISSLINQYKDVCRTNLNLGTRISSSLEEMNRSYEVFLKNITDYIDNQNALFTSDISNSNITRERLGERLRMYVIATNTRNFGNLLVNTGVEGFNNRESEAINNAIKEYVPVLKRNISELVSLTQQEVNKRRLDEVLASVNNFANSLEIVARDVQAMAENAARGIVVYSDVIAKTNAFAELIAGAASGSATDLAKNMNTAVTIVLWILIISIILGLTLAWLITSGIVKPVSIIINDLASGSNEVASASGQVSSSGQELAKNANEQASSLEETSASLEELASMTKQNTENARQVNIMSSEAKESSVKGRDTVEKMTVAITKIKESSDETVKIIKTIDEIAFQTNLLALNAAVEAARAGEAGKGFAVVAEEVRNLAQRAGEAAKNTAVLIDESKNNSEQGVKVAEEVSTILGDITGKIIKMNELAVEVASASEEQTKGIDQINTAVSQIEKITQANAANSEESAAASEELTAQSEKLLEYVEVLRDIVYGENHNGNEAGMRRERSARETGLNRGKTANKTGMNLKQKTIAKTTPKATAKHTTKTKAEEIIPLDDSDF